MPKLKFMSSNYRLPELVDRERLRMNNRHSNPPTWVSEQPRIPYSRRTTGKHQWAWSPFLYAHIQDT